MTRTAIYAHFSSSERVNPHVFTTLRALRDLGFSIVFVTTSPVDAPSQKDLDALCARCLFTENIGYDFYAWKKGMEVAAPAECSQLLLMNSSVLGPLRPLDRVFAAMAKRKPDFWGITDSQEIRYHVQSYFLVFERRILQSEVFASFWRDLVPVSERQQVIYRYETQLTRLFNQHGFSSDSYLSRRKILLRNPGLFFRRRKQNTTIFHPLEAYKAGLPFLKIQLIRDNPGKIDLWPLVNRLRRDQVLRPEFSELIEGFQPSLGKHERIQL